MLTGALVFVLFVTICSAIKVSLTINVHYPKSVNLSLRGNNLCGLTWDKGVAMKQSMLQSGHYISSADLSCDLTSGSNLEVKVLIQDGVWMLGANHHVDLTHFTNNSTSTNIDNMYPWFYTYQGSLTTISRVYSNELKNFRDVIIYLPPSYFENTLKIHQNILIMHDGQNLFDPKTSAFGTAWMCQDSLDNTINSAQSDEVIIVGAYNTADRINEYTYIYDPSENAGGKGDLYLDWIESTLLPLIQKELRVTIQRQTLGILGSSLGGLISCYAGWTRATIYGKVGCMSSSFWWDDNHYQKHVLIEQSIDTSNPLPVFYLDAGTSPEEATCAIYTTQIYEYDINTIGFVANENIFQYIDEGGKHNEASWGSRFKHPLIALYPANTV
jgi:predicted alpha/beta superfamily hydrolase